MGDTHSRRELHPRRGIAELSGSGDEEVLVRQGTGPSRASAGLLFSMDKTHISKFVDFVL
jgi:hypothetical protein